MQSLRVIARCSLLVLFGVLCGVLTSCGSGGQAGGTTAGSGSGGSTAPVVGSAAVMYAAYNSGFLVQSNGEIYYATTLTSQGTSEAKMYTGANDIEVAEDAYQYDHNPTDQATVVALLNRYLVANGTDWSYDGWNDDIGWMTNIFIRGYQLTGQANYLTEAENEWNMGYNRGWDSTLGGGIWENNTDGGKEALSNDNFIFEAVQLYQLSGDSTYLTKAEGIYSWVRSNLVNTTTSNNSKGVPGQVNQGVNANGSLNTGDNLYNSGTWVKAANDLYRVTGTQMYHDDALLTITHVISAEPTLKSTSECCGNQWAYWFTQGLSEFATDNNQWGAYLSFMQSNANQSWSERCSLNLTWNDWTNATNCTEESDPMEMGSAVEIWMNLPPAALSLSGNYELLNVSSGLAVSVAGASTAQGAGIVQEPMVSGAKASLWTFVATSGGYYRIVNGNSGLAMKVTGDVSTDAVKGALIEQWPAQGSIPGDDQWMPVENGDGSYSFYSLNSYQALDVPGSGKSSGVQLDQWFGNGGTNQKFNLVAQ
jgi:hypothetical protein